ncbi:hypothetical protein DITRI_Ditri14bG0049000 [Diplodiscus trichospermus]
MLQQIASYVLIEDASSTDDIFWGPNESGLFTVASAYKLSVGNDVQVDKIWMIIWHLQVPNRIRSFIWLLQHDRVMCNKERMRRGLTSFGGCEFCNGSLEDMDHVLRKCPEASNLWQSLLPAAKFHKQGNLSFHEWLQYNLCASLSFAGFPNWPASFAITLWWLWKWRNAFVFSGERFSKDYKCRWVRSQAIEIARVLEQLSLFAATSRSTTIQVGWNFPAQDWIALNVDGSVDASSQAAGCGGLLRDCHGRWMHGFTFNIGKCTVLEVEFWAVIHRLQSAWEKGFRKIILQSDSRSVVNSLKSGISSSLKVKNLLEVAQNLMKREWAVSVTHVYREGNKVTDILAKMALLHDRGIRDLCDRPEETKLALLHDSLGTLWPRVVNVTIN